MRVFVVLFFALAAFVLSVVVIAPAVMTALRGAAVATGVQQIERGVRDTIGGALEPRLEPLDSGFGPAPDRSRLRRSKPTRDRLKPEKRKAILPAQPERRDLDPRRIDPQARARFQRPPPSRFEQRSREERRQRRRTSRGRDER